jgi:hypothetical protein
VKKGILILVGFAVFAFVGFALYLWQSDINPSEESAKIELSPAPKTETSATSETAEERAPASTPSPQEQYRKALVEEEQMKRSPTWEEMRKEAPAEF